MPNDTDNTAGSDCPAATCSLSDSELLRELLNCFYWNGEGLEWSYIEGTHIGSVLTPEIEARLQEIKENA
jgi:hypothetical protein